MKDKKMWGFVGAALAVMALWTVYNNSVKVPGKPDAPKPVPVADKAEEGPTAVITDGAGNPPPDVVEVGDSVLLKSDKSITGNEPKSRNWWIDPQERLSKASLLENGSTLNIPVGRKEGQVRVILMTAKDNRTAFRVYTFTVKDIGAPEPARPVPVKPVPDPTNIVVVPTPAPTPPMPQPVIEEVRQPVDPLKGFKTAIDSLQIPTKVSDDEIKAVATAFKKVAGQIEDGTITTTTSMTGNTADEIRGTIGLNDFLPWVKWRDEVLVVLESAKLKTFKEHSKYWAAVGDVLLTKLKAK